MLTSIGIGIELVDVALNRELGFNLLEMVLADFEFAQVQVVGERLDVWMSLGVLDLIFDRSDHRQLDLFFALTLDW